MAAHLLGATTQVAEAVTMATNLELERRVCALRNFINKLATGEQSPVAESEIEEIARAALLGNYKLDEAAHDARVASWKQEVDAFQQRVEAGKV